MEKSGELSAESSKIAETSISSETLQEPKENSSRQFDVLTQRSSKSVSEPLQKKPRQSSRLDDILSGIIPVMESPRTLPTSNHFALTLEKLYKSLESDKSLLPSGWKFAWDDSRSRSLVFYKLDLAVHPVKILLSVRVSMETSTEISNESSVLVPHLCLDQQELSSFCVTLLLGYEDIRSENDLIRLLNYMDKMICSKATLSKGTPRAIGNGDHVHGRGNVEVDTDVNQNAAENGELNGESSRSLQSEAVDSTLQISSSSLQQFMKTVIREAVEDIGDVLQKIVAEKKTKPAAPKIKSKAIPQFPCPQCGRMYHSAEAVQNHTNKHHEKIRIL